MERKIDHVNELEIKTSPELPRLVFGDDPDLVITALGKIEGDQWVLRQRQLLHDEDFKDELSDWTVKGAWRFLRSVHQQLGKLREELACEIDPEEKLLIEKEISNLVDGKGIGVSTIYGTGGFNRYFVRSNGQIVIGKDYIIPTKLRGTIVLAENLGIEVV